MKKVLFTATVDEHILAFHIPFLKLFKENGYEVHVATNGNAEIPFCDKKFKVTFERSPFKINNLKAIKQLKSIIEKEKYDIIHTHTPMGSVVTRLVAIKARKKGTRVIYTAHGFHFFKGAPLINWLIYYPIEKVLAKYTDTLILINKEDYDLANKHFRAKQIELVHGVGVDKGKFDFEMSEEEKLKIRSEFGFEKDDYVFISVGELNKNKNQLMQIEAIKKVVENNENIKLLIVGKGKLDIFLKDKVKEYGLGSVVKFAGFRKDIPQLLKSSNCLLATSYREGLPVNVMEAMMCSLPIIVTNCRGQRDLIDRENIVEINDVEELSKKILKKHQNVQVKVDYNVDTIELDKIIKKMKNIYNI